MSWVISLTDKTPKYYRAVAPTNAPSDVPLEGTSLYTSSCDHTFRPQAWPSAVNSLFSKGLMAKLKTESDDSGGVRHNFAVLV